MKIKIASLMGLSLAAAAVAGEAQASGFATYFAVVSGTGGVSRSSGLASVAQTSTGAYTLTFNRDISYCAYVASVKATTPAYATASLKSGTTTSLAVHTFTNSGTASNQAFNVIVTCAP